MPPVHRHQPPGRLQAVDAAPARRRPDRAALVAADGAIRLPLLRPAPHCRPTSRPADARALSGLRIGPVAQVWLPAEKHRVLAGRLAGDPCRPPPGSGSQPSRRRPARSPRARASHWPSARPATQMLSLIATCLPASTPSAAPSISHRQYQAFSGFSPGAGRQPEVRGYLTGSAGSTSSSTRA